MTTLETVMKVHNMLCTEARSIISTKGHDYNREQQQNGDTLFNLTVSQVLGITETTTQGILTRLGDKFMRLISLTKSKHIKAAVKNESVKDTTKDIINYVTYNYIKYCEMNGIDPLG